ncbi:MAG TPA: hypothetical protein VL443_21735 [Cyclobacteriaceae bacterium]|jgi:hypothetical protein|nr:hypothetical protein [Cyclobacteriaceae bacterium]
MKKLLYLFICLTVAGCSPPEYLTAEELTKYISDPDHGLVQHAEVNGYSMDVTYKPTDLLVLQEAGDHADDLKITALRDKYSKYCYFILSLSKNSKEALHQVEPNQYGDLVQTLSFRMGGYVNMTTSLHDTIPTTDFVLDRTYGLSSVTSLLFVFDREKAKDKDWVQFNLNEFGLGVGNQRFRFRIKDLENTPKIKFEVSKSQTRNERP